MNKELLHLYRRARAHQLATYTPTILTYPDGTVVTEWTGGGAAYGEHALSAYWFARRHIAFMRDLGRTVRENKKRSRAAKRGWKTRRANARGE